MELKKVYDFLIELKFNNNRDWFQENKSAYDKAKQIFELFIEGLIPHIMEFDDSINHVKAKDCIFRIYRDVRFSKDKSPYKNHFGALIGAAGRKSIKAGYYIHIEPDASFIGGGIYRPDSAVLKLIRNEIYYNIDEFKSIVNDDEFKSKFTEIIGEKLKLPPKGFPKDFQDIDLLKHKSYAVMHPVQNNFWFENNVADKIMDVFRIQSRLNQFLNSVFENSEIS